MKQNDKIPHVDGEVIPHNIDESTADLARKAHERFGGFWAYQCSYSELGMRFALLRKVSGA